MPREPSEVWEVWTESGEYENFSRDLRGLFATEELAQAHADQLKATREYDRVEVAADRVQSVLPARVPCVQWSAHIWPNGTVDMGLGRRAGRQFDTWDNELAPLESSRCDPWSHGEAADLYIEAVGSDPELVKAEYQRLLIVAREQIKTGRRDPGQKEGGSDDCS